MLALAPAWVPLNFDERLRISLLEEQQPGVLGELLTSGQLSYLCVASGHLRRMARPSSIQWPEQTVVAVGEDGVVGFAAIERAQDTTTGQLTVGVESAWARTGAASRLIAEAAHLARRAGLARIETQVYRETSLALFQTAGLRMVSSMPLGGVTDVALALR